MEREGSGDIYKQRETFKDNKIHQQENRNDKIVQTNQKFISGQPYEFFTLGIKGGKVRLPT